MAKKKRKQQPPDMATVRLDEIDMGTARIRTTINKDDLAELTYSIRELGLLQPVVLMERARPKSGEKPYSLLIGQRRFLACQKLEKLGELEPPEIPAMILKEQDRKSALTLSLAENICRAKLSHRDAAEVVTELYKTHGRNIKTVAKITGMWPETVRRYVAVKECGSDKIMKLLENARISLEDAKHALLAAEWNVKKAERMLDLMVKEGFTRSAKRRFTRYVGSHPGTTLSTAGKEARKARIERRVSVDLTKDLRAGLEKATDEWGMEAEDVVTQALQDWLEDQGYIE